MFVDSLEVGLTSGHRNTIHSCNSSHHAIELLQLYNPQDAEEESTPSSAKRFRPTVISYAAATASTNVTTASSNSSPAQTQQFTSISSLTDQDLDQLYERLKRHVEVVDDDSPGISTEEMEKMVQESNNTILQAREETRKSVAELTAQVDNINTAVRKQNVVVVALQKTLAETSLDLKTSVNEKVGDLSSQIQELRSLVMSLLPPSAHKQVAMSGGAGGVMSPYRTPASTQGCDSGKGRIQLTLLQFMCQSSSVSVPICSQTDLSISSKTPEK